MTSARRVGPTVPRHRSIRLATCENRRHDIRPSASETHRTGEVAEGSRYSCKRSIFRDPATDRAADVQSNRQNLKERSKSLISLSISTENQIQIRGLKMRAHGRDQRFQKDDRISRFYDKPFSSGSEWVGSMCGYLQYVSLKLRSILDNPGPAKSPKT